MNASCFSRKRKEYQKWHGETSRATEAPTVASALILPFSPYLINIGTVEAGGEEEKGNASSASIFEAKQGIEASKLVELRE